MTTPLVLTDAPAVVELKRRFRIFDEAEEKLRPLLDQPHQWRPFVKAAKEILKTAKRDIARQIFNLENTNKKLMINPSSNYDCAGKSHYAHLKNPECSHCGDRLKDEERAAGICVTCSELENNRRYRLHNSIGEYAD